MTKMTPKQTRILYRKLHKFDNIQWYGYLTPVEILYLVNMGCRNIYHSKQDRKEFIERLNTYIKNGTMYSAYFYFVPSKNVMENLKR